MPGHGRAAVDSHLDLPVVTADRAALERDFAPFRALADLPMAMTAHIVFTALDPDRPVTTSKRAIDAVVRGEIGFDGLLLSDDLSMEALKGTLGERAAAASAAGCDILLHCNGVMAEARAVAAAAPMLGGPRRRARRRGPGAPGRAGAARPRARPRRLRGRRWRPESPDARAGPAQPRRRSRRCRPRPATTQAMPNHCAALSASPSSTAARPAPRRRARR